MKEYIEKSLRRPVTIEENVDVWKKLPLKYKGNYNLYSVYLNKIEWLIAQPKEDLRLTALRNDRNQIEKASGLNCAFYFTKLNHYSKDTMMNEGIPFIVVEKQVYLPFLGMILSDKDDRRLAPVREISFLTQKLLLCALYEKWQGMNVTKIAEKLGVTKMSVTRCLDEIEYLGIDVLDTTGKSRKVTVEPDTRKLWDKIRTFLRNPVITKYQLAEDIGLERKAGMSALCEYSLISDNLYPTYGITKKELKETALKGYRQIGTGEDMGCEVLELGYFIGFNGKQIQDPLSVLLSMSDKDMEDERVQQCVEEMLEEYVW